MQNGLRLLKQIPLNEVLSETLVNPKGERLLKNGQAPILLAGDIILSLIAHHSINASIFFSIESTAFCSASREE